MSIPKNTLPPTQDTTRDPHRQDAEKNPSETRPEKPKRCAFRQRRAGLTLPLRASPWGCSEAAGLGSRRQGLSPSPLAAHPAAGPGLRLPGPPPPPTPGSTHLSACSCGPGSRRLSGRSLRRRYSPDCESSLSCRAVMLAHRDPRSPAPEGGRPPGLGTAPRAPGPGSGLGRRRRPRFLLAGYTRSRGRPHLRAGTWEGLLLTCCRRAEPGRPEQSRRPLRGPFRHRSASKLG